MLAHQNITQFLFLKKFKKYLFLKNKLMNIMVITLMPLVTPL